MTAKRDTLNTRRTMDVGGKAYSYYSLPAAAEKLGDISRLPFSLKVLLECLLRTEDGIAVMDRDIRAMAHWLKDRKSDDEIQFTPSRVLMQDFTGVPAVADLAAMRDGIKTLGGRADQINPLVAVDLVIDHSVMVDEFGSPRSFQRNVDLEFERNNERYEFLRWGQDAFKNFRVVPPGTGICHQVNLEYLAQVAWTRTEENGEIIVYPDSLVGTDSHTTMINGLAVLGWGVGGIEAEAAMLGQPISMLIPEVIGFKLSGAMPEGATATDLVLTVTEMLRKKGVVGKFVEFYGPGISSLSLADRATIANMAPEYGATCGFFPIDDETIRYLNFTGRDPHRTALVEAYAKLQGMWRYDSMEDPVFTDTLELNMSTVVPSMAGPKRPQDRIELPNIARAFEKDMPSMGVTPEKRERTEAVEGTSYSVKHGDVVIAAITSCTNTSNPSVMLAAGLVARNAAAKGLKVKPWVKTSLAPGSQVVTDYLNAAGLQDDLDTLGFNLVGYGCTTCIGNSGPLPEHISKAVEKGDLCVASVLSGNRNFEGRVQQQVKANYLASPPLVVAYALAGSVLIDITTAPLGTGSDGQPVYLRDIWPTNQQIADVVSKSLTPAMFRDRYSNVFVGPEQWQKLQTAKGETYDWNDKSTYVKQPPFFSDVANSNAALITDIRGAKALAILGDSVTTDHISPAGNIKKSSPAGEYLTAHGVSPLDFNSYGARRGNHEIMMRGTFANIRIKNEMVPGTEGGVTRYLPTDETMAIYDAAMKYEADGTPLVIIAGKEYGTGSSRDWAAKGTKLLGAKAVIAESFERIHRSNLVGMGVLPLQFQDGITRKTLQLTGDETFAITGLVAGIKPRMTLNLEITRKDGGKDTVPLICRIDTLNEVEYFKAGGILTYVLRDMAKRA
jgi:aconitate hydratase